MQLLSARKLQQSPTLPRFPSAIPTAQPPPLGNSITAALSAGGTTGTPSAPSDPLVSGGDTNPPSFPSLPLTPTEPLLSQPAPAGSLIGSPAFNQVENTPAASAGDQNISSALAGAPSGGPSQGGVAGSISGNSPSGSLNQGGGSGSGSGNGGGTVASATGAAGPTPASSSGSITSAAVKACDWKQGGANCSATASCVPDPNVPALDLALPLTYFPLTGGSLNSWPYSGKTGQIGAGNVSWVPDPLFGSVMTCTPGSRVVLAPLQGLMYGRSGAWAVNLWMKKQANDSSSGLYEYLFSHAAASAQSMGAYNSSSDGFAENQIELFMPSRSKALYGIVRAVVKDSNDGPAPVYVDSDGAVGDNQRRTPIFGATNLTDGDWHMVTITTWPSGRRGYRMFIDGTIAVQIPNQEYPGPSNPEAEIDGGDPIILTGRLNLCGRAGNSLTADVMRDYAGAISQLSLYDSALTSREVALLFGAVRGFRKKPIPPAPCLEHSISDPTGMIVQQAGCGCAGRSAPPLYDFSGPATATAAGNGTGSPTGNGNGTVFNQPTGAPCTLDLYKATGLAFCAPGLICAANPPSNATTAPADAASGDPVVAAAAAAVASLSRLLQQRVGTCAVPLPGALVPDSYPPLWPPPIAYFPLTEQSLQTWPDGGYGGTGHNVSWELDTRFGNVLSCNASNFSYVTLDAVPYAANGPFAINLWVKMASSDMNGSLFEYVFSHTAAAGFTAMGPDQIHIFVPEASNALYGLAARVIVKDHEDADTGPESNVWLDSDGRVAFEGRPDGTRADDGVDMGDAE
ncbi:MAG: hypothetical protein WDW38_002168 [Sanguina aurantia]